METKIEFSDKLNGDKYSQEISEITINFSKEIMKELKQFIRSIILFGSSSREILRGIDGEILSNIEKKMSMHSYSQKSDIDILIIFDDVSYVLSKEILEFYNIIVSKARKKVSPRIHVTTVSLTSFYEYTRVADPIMVSALRDGFVIYDENNFEIFQKLLLRGKIRPTPESVLNYYVKSMNDISRAKTYLLKSFIDLYWAVIDASHALLMKVGVIPQSPDNVPFLIKDLFVNSNLVSKDMPTKINNFYKMAKSVSDGHVTHMTGLELDHYMNTAQDLLEEIKHLIDMKDVILIQKMKKLKEISEDKR